MKILLRILSVVFVAIALFLTVVVVTVVADGHPRWAACIAYLVGSAILVFAAVKMWQATSRPQAPTT
jgi:uncharacterized membrane protein YqjE